MLLHPQYSPDLAPLDYHLFIPLQNNWNRKNVNDFVDDKSYLFQLFLEKN